MKIKVDMVRLQRMLNEELSRKSERRGEEEEDISEFNLDD